MKRRMEMRVSEPTAGRMSEAVTAVRAAMYVKTTFSSIRQDDF